MIAAIAAVDENFGIGYKGELLERIPEDLKYFKSKTDGATVIMGRRTWESLPYKPLPNRKNIVITSHYDSFNDASHLTMNLDEAIHYIETTDETVFIIGGETIYEQLLPWCNDLYITKIYKSYDNVDAYFPNVNAMTSWTLTDISDIQQYKGIEYSFCHYSRV